MSSPMAQCNNTSLEVRWRVVISTYNAISVYRQFWQKWTWTTPQRRLYICEVMFLYYLNVETLRKHNLSESNKNKLKWKRKSIVHRLSIVLQNNKHIDRRLCIYYQMQIIKWTIYVYISSTRCKIIKCTIYVCISSTKYETWSTLCKV